MNTIALRIGFVFFDDNRVIEELELSIAEMEFAE